MRATPMLEQYWSLKREVPDAILLYRLGDFYEMFFEDAETAAPLLGLMLTARHKDSDIQAPMCGVPHHALDTYVARLVAAGRKVAISEQTEAPGRGKAIVARKIVRVVTPGTVVDADRLDARRASELAAVARNGAEIALAFLDVSTGDFSALRLDGAAGPEEVLARRLPKEVVCFPSDREEVARWLLPLGADAPVLSALAAESPRGERARDLLLAQLKTATLQPFGLRPDGPETDAAAALLHYAKSTQRSECAHVATLRVEEAADGLVVDAITAQHLELFRSLRDGSRSGTLLEILDRTETSFGARELRRMLERPAGRWPEIEGRLDAVEELVDDPKSLEEVARALKGIPDLPRLVARLSVGAASPRELDALAEGLLRAGALAKALGDRRAVLLRAGGDAAPDAIPLDVARRVKASLVAEPPSGAREGGVFRDGLDAEVDELRRLRKSAASVLAEVEAAERTRRGIATLRVKFNQVFGHVFEVPGSARAKIPEDALKRQTLASVERYSTPELAAVDEKLRSADARLAEREQALFAQLVADVVAEAPRLLWAAARVARLDALVSLARVARASRWTRPKLVDEPVLFVVDGRHPVVEALRPKEPFVPNDTSLGQDDRVLVLTGPNMGGKSTYLRQNALLLLLAHVGSFVPAASATVGLCDRIFTRVGASDSLAKGESTFLVEMAETAHILRHATRRSLVVLDEVGRGTSTFDGLSLAWSIAERLHDGNGDVAGPARVLFATHYHELTEIALVKPGVANRTMAVKEWNGEVVFLRKVIEGVADRSYGVAVARLAGIPEPVLVRAREAVEEDERRDDDVFRVKAEAAPCEDDRPRTGLREVDDRCEVDVETEEAGGAAHEVRVLVNAVRPLHGARRGGREAQAEERAEAVDG
ncbi:MAG TPA: DNA mismatch repair protein MutS, partial [Thermoanaerobaculia bacterium]|nr:DNA mismatch repair protein MutS [Thermoanaerobaculia bacterium]